MLGCDHNCFVTSCKRCWCDRHLPPVEVQSSECGGHWFDPGTDPRMGCCEAEQHAPARCFSQTTDGLCAPLDTTHLGARCQSNHVTAATSDPSCKRTRRGKLKETAVALLGCFIPRPHHLSSTSSQCLLSTTPRPITPLIPLCILQDDQDHCCYRCHWRTGWQCSSHLSQTRWLESSRHHP